MFRLRPLPACLFLAGLVPVAGEPLLTAYHTSSPPVIDGRLHDACWKTATVTSPFLSAQRPGFPKAQTRARVCWDEANLYCAVEAEEPFLNPALNMLSRVKVSQSGRDANVFHDECVEVFVQPRPQAVFHFAANAGTGRYEARNHDAAWNGPWECAVRREKNRYLVEIAIPWSTFGTRPQDDWRINFCRERTAARELSTWTGLQGPFYQPESFGILRFAEAGPALSEVHWKREGNRVTFTARVTGSGLQTTVLEVEATADHKQATGVAAATGAGNLRAEVTLPEVAFRSGRAVLRYRLRQGTRLYVESAALPHFPAAGIVTLTAVIRHATVAAFVNGGPVSLPDGIARLELGEGMNVVTLDAVAQGRAPVVKVSLTANDHPLSPRWQVRTTPPPADWRKSIPPRGWGEPAPVGPNLWPGSAAQRVFFACGIYVSKPGPVFFPHVESSYFPRGSRQLCRLYVPAPVEVPQQHYALVVEAPPWLTYRAVEPIGGGTPNVSAVGTVQVGGASLTRYEVGYDLIPGSGFELSLRWGDRSNTTLAYQPTIRAGGTFDWRHFAMEVTPPPGAVSVHPLIIKWQNRRITGTFWVDNVSFHEKGSTKNLVTGGTFDEPEYGRDGHLVPEGPDGSKCVKIVSTPQAADRQQAFWVGRNRVVPVQVGKRYVIELDLRCDKLGAPSGKPLCGLLFETSSKAPLGRFPLFVSFRTFAGAVVSLPRQGRGVVLPPLKNVRPKHARLCPCYYSARFHTAEVSQAYADNCWAAGITWIYGRQSNDVVPRLTPRGLKTILSLGWEPWHALRGMKAFLSDHPEVRAVGFTGKPVLNVFCPTWFLHDGGPCFARLEQWLRQTLSAGSFAGVNWDIEQPVVDPPTFCTCRRCLAAFRRFAGLPVDAALDPKKDLLGRYRRQWTDFRCQQNADLAGRLKQLLAKLDERVEFSVYSGYQSVRTQEHYGVDWARMAPHLDFAIAGYGGSREAVTATRTALGDVPFMGGEMWYLSDTNDAQPTPRMETWRNRLLRQFFNSGCHGCLIWWLPAMDGGAFFATSEAAELIAAHEDFFASAARCEQEFTVTGLPASDWFAFAKNGERLVVLLNFRGTSIPVTVQRAGRTRQVQLAAYGVEVVTDGNRGQVHAPGSR